MTENKHLVDAIIDLIMLPFRIAFWVSFIVLRTLIKGLNH